MALNEMLKASNDDDIRELLEMKEKARHDEASRVYNATMEGIAKGEQIGIVKGKTEAKKELLIILLTKKFGILSEDIGKKIISIENTDVIKKIVDNIFELNSPDQVMEFLE